MTKTFDTQADPEIIQQINDEAALLHERICRLKRPMVLCVEDTKTSEVVWILAGMGQDLFPKQPEAHDVVIPLAVLPIGYEPLTRFRPIEWGDVEKDPTLVRAES